MMWKVIVGFILAVQVVARPAQEADIGAKLHRFLPRFANCVRKSLTDVEQWQSKCHVSSSCWSEKFGHRGFKCAVEINILEAASQGVIAEEQVAYLIANGTELVAGPMSFIYCMAGCLGIPSLEIVPTYYECDTDPECWLMKLGNRGYECAVEWCASPVTKDIGAKLHGFLPRFANCVGKSLADVEQWQSKCHVSSSCWSEKFGHRGFKCAVEINILEAASQGVIAEKQVAYLIANGTELVGGPISFIKCMATCVGKSIPEIVQIYNECGIDILCWVKELGSVAFSCVVKCAVGVDASPVTKDIGAKLHGFLPRFANCVGKSLADVEQWQSKCHVSYSCWSEKFGHRGFKCAIEINVLEAASQGVIAEKHAAYLIANGTELAGVPVYGIVCMATCVGKSIPEIVQIYNECGINPLCWVKKLGYIALECVVKCLVSVDAGPITLVRPELLGRNPCNSVVYGHYEGELFSDEREAKNGDITGFEIWYDDYKINAIQFHYNSERGDLHGQAKGKVVNELLLPGEYITKIAIWTEGPIQGLAFYTSLGNKYGPYGNTNPSVYWVSGKLFFITGRAEMVLNQIQFHYICN